MKKLLKFILMPMLVGTPVMTVVACGADNSQTDDNDILNSAVGRMVNHEFKMKEDLGMGSLPLTGKSYNSLTSSVRTTINQYFSDLVTNGINWDYPSVQVTITGINGKNFIRKYGPNIDSKIDLTVHLKFKDLPERTKIITIKINNDLKTGQEKADTLKTYLVDYFNNNDPSINFRTLLPDGIMNTDPSISTWVQKINAYLRTALLDKDKNTANGSVIDVDKVSLQVVPAAAGSIYSLNNQAVDATNKTINGVVENLAITLNYDNQGFSIINTATDLTTQKIKVAQDFTDAQNQIATSLKQGPEALVFGMQGGTMPTANEKYSDYDAGNGLTDKVQTKIFSYIEKTFPTAKIAPVSDPWDKTAIIVPSQSSLFVMDDDTSGKEIGHFNIDLEFKVKIDPTYTIDMKVSDVQLNLNANIAP